jgi:predicted nucleotide-binding protein (sugar kinase/HSP70/actin superfamily)
MMIECWIKNQLPTMIYLMLSVAQSSVILKMLQQMMSYENEEGKVHEILRSFFGECK